MVTNFTKKVALLALCGMGSVAMAQQSPSTQPDWNAIINNGANNSNSWSQKKKLVSSDRSDSDEFGYSVAISGDYAVVGARYEKLDAAGGNSVSNAGAAYIFVRNGSSWSQQQKIVSSDRFKDYEFGNAVAIDGETVIVGEL